MRGSLEAINAALLELGNNEVEVRIVGDGVGGITENDVNLAMTTRAIVVGFNVAPMAAHANWRNAKAWTFATTALFIS